MKIEQINTEQIHDIESARYVINQLKDCIFEMKRDINRQLNNLSSQNVRTLDFAVTKVFNANEINTEG